MKLFQKKGDWKDFKKYDWKKGNDTEGQKRVADYEKLAACFIKYLKEVAKGTRPNDELGILDEKALSAEISRTDTQTAQTKFCIYCGAAIKVVAEFCPKCGKKQ